MELKSFIKQNRKDWEQLEQALMEMSRRKSKLTPEVLDKFQLQYQKVSHHLSIGQTFFPNEEVTIYLNDLVSKAHNLLYRDKVSSFNQLRSFFGHTFIRLFVEQKTFILIAFGLFLVGAVGGFLSVMSNPLHLYSVLPSSIANAIDPEQIGPKAVDSPFMSAAIMTNNIQVAFMAFAGGLTLGILTIYSMVYNGLILGALAALYMQHDRFFEFWAFILPHGMIELTAIFIAGGAGLIMGYSIIVPGPYSRTFQLKRHAIRSVQLLLGTIPLFVIAGIIEGYITPSHISLQAKYIFALFTVIALVLYIWIGGYTIKNKSTAIHD